MAARTVTYSQWNAGEIRRLAKLLEGAAADKYGKLTVAVTGDDSDATVKFTITVGGVSIYG
jgi:hypothetical protein